MAKGNLARCLAVTLKFEGGWSDHPKDPGGATMKGITLATFRKYRPQASKQDLRNISNADVETIYHHGYWSEVNGDALPFGVDLTVFDYGVNSGPSRGVKALQAEVGATVDGKPGADTIARAAKADGKTLIQKICSRRMRFLKALPTFGTFGKGWSRRVAEVEAAAVVMWLGRGVALTPAAKAEIESEAKTAEQTAGKQSGQAAGTAAAGGVGGGADIAASGEPNWLLIAGVAVLVVVVAGILVSRARHNRERAAAYLAAAS